MTPGSLLALAAAAGPPTGFDLLRDLAVILCVAALTTILFQRIHQPVVLGYLLAGMIVGPHLPIPLFADTKVAHTLSELGVILLMFSLGMEFSLRKLVKVGPTAGIVAVIECSLMIWLGYIVSGAFGWTGYERLFTGVLVAISSTTIIVKAFAEQKIKGPLTELVFGILIVEDLIAILALAILTAAASGAGLSAGALAVTIGQLAGFLVGLLVVGMLIVPRLIRFVVKLDRPETTLVASIGICFASALLARRFGYSVALGAFLGGALVAESGVSRTIEHLVEPVRDVFAAVFFVSVGMLIDPGLVFENWPAVLALTLVVMSGKLVGVTIGAFIAGNGVRTSVQAGMSLAQIGEFSFIIAGVGLQLGATRHFLYPVAVAVSALTTLSTPWLIRASDAVASRIDAGLPHPLQTHVTLYASWVRQLRSTPGHRTAWSKIRRLVGLLFLDLAILASIVVAVSVERHRLIQLLDGVAFVKPELALWVVVGAGVLLLLPFALGAIRIAQALGLALAAEALPSSAGGLDLAAAPRRALLVSLQIAILLIAGIPLVAITQPFLPGFPAFIVLLVGILALVVPLWKSAANLQGHVRAGAQVILEALASQSVVKAPSRPNPSQSSLELARLVPGLGDATTVRLTSVSAAVGKTLKQINLRGETGATVIAIHRPGIGVVYPTGDELLQTDEILVLTGTRDSVSAARRILHEGEPPPSPPTSEAPTITSA
jgi:monovalent cation:H+ antiporter-2, CPA2 family